MTIAREKMSASLLYFPPFITSGAVHRRVLLRRSKVLSSESTFVVTVARQKSVIRAWPWASTRTFDWHGYQYGDEIGVRIATYSLEVSMSHIGGVEVAQAPRNVR